MLWQRFLEYMEYAPPVGYSPSAGRTPLETSPSRRPQDPVPSTIPDDASLAMLSDSELLELLAARHREYLVAPMYAYARNRQLDADVKHLRALADARLASVPTE